MNSIKRFKGRPIVATGLVPTMLLALISAVLVQTSKAQELLTFPRPAWFRNGPIVIAGNWWEVPVFRRRVGGSPTWNDAQYLREHSEENVKKLKDLGVTLAIIHFDWGFGIEAEKDSMQEANKLASLCHKYGIRVGVYIGGTIGYETFLLEKPEAQDWLVPDYEGKPMVWFTQTFRRRVYFMHPGYRDYIKQLVRIAIKDLKVDFIHFDHASALAPAETFFHPLAIQDFKEFLTRKYTPTMLSNRLGFSDLKYVTPPHPDIPQSASYDPLFQEWLDFRCDELSSFYKEMVEYVQSLNPQVAVDLNPARGLSGVNTIWIESVDYPRLLKYSDAVWSEETEETGYDSGITPDGVLVSRIRTYKMAATLNNKVFTYTTQTFHKSNAALQMAEAMAYGRQCIGMVGGMLAGDELPAGPRNYIKFYLKEFEHYRDVVSVADVAVLHSFETMAFNNDRPYQSTYLYEQALIQAKVPFDIIFDENLKDLSKYRVLVLADQECLTGDQINLITQYVRGGGGLVVTEHTSLYAEGRHRRPDFGLKELLKVQAPFEPWQYEVRPEAPLNISSTKSEFGRGRVIYLPEVKPVVEKPATLPMRSNYWKLPVNWNELIEAIKWAAAGKLSIEVKAPLTVTAEVQSQETTGALMVHLLNYDTDKNPFFTNIEVSLRTPAGKTVKEVMALSPDRGEAQSISYTVIDGRAIFVLPRLQTYSLIFIKFS